MLRLSLGAVRDRWQLFAGAVVAVALGVGLVQSGLQVLAATDRPELPPGLSKFDQARIREGYVGAATLLGMSVMLAVFLTVFVVSTTFGFTVAQRRRELALLRLVGAQRGSLRLMLLGEALILGVLGTAAGVPAGLLGTWAQSELLIRLGMLPSWFRAPWDTGSMEAAAIVGIGTALAGVLAAAWRASRIAPLEALTELPEGMPVMTGWRWFWGLSATACTVVLVIAAQAARDLVAGLMIALVVMISGSVALSQLSPIAVPLAGRLPALVLRGSLVADLARENVLYAVRRGAATAAPLIVLVGLLVGLWGTFGSLAKAVGEEQRQLITADLVVGSEVPASQDITVASPQTVVPVTVIRQAGKRKQTVYSEAVGIEWSAYQRTHRLRPRKGSLDRLVGRTIAIGPGMSAEGYKLGSTVTAVIGTRRLPLKVVAIMPETLDVGDNFFVPRALAGEGRTETLVKVAPGNDIRTVARRLEAGGEVRTVAEWAEARGEVQQRGNTGIFAVLMGLAGVYAAVAVVNAVVMAAADRRREFALTRMAGLTRAQVVTVALVESLTVVVIGVLLGCLVAAAALAGVAAGTANTYGVVVLAIPWRLLGLILGGALLVVGGTAAATAWTVTRHQPVSLLGGRD
ncbi:putative ABC transport system permease protein [Kribbella voronezhensis]|uniref:Putative ABC transport system permease protein n=1 Tax=Kribbella voronezhensis TaxID=2512212 RepID=A0A4R7TGD1_9ACTN|nr:ABC transporter permease [Kribbella voronezhensis]TDU90507.1 putative ABC transport system permease protein [Kribbella voronezhensis]